MFIRSILVALAITQTLCFDKKFFDECAKELKLEINPNSGAVSNKSDTTCLMKCIYQKEGKIDENANIIPENNHKILQPYLKKCEENIKETNVCKRVHDIDECIDDDYDTISKEIVKLCAQETNTEFEITASGLDFEDFNKACFNKCVLEIMGVLDGSGDVNYSDLVTNGDYIFKGNADKVVKKCEDENKQDDQCLKSMKRLTCFMTKFD